MKNFKFIQATCYIIFTLFFANSCNNPNSDTAAKLKYIESDTMSFNDFKQKLQGNITSLSADSLTNCTSCETPIYCGISKNELETNMRNYRENIWQKNCEFTNGHTTTNYDETDKLDARLMEISIEELENYICTAKKTAHNQHDEIQSIRFYYIQYPGKVGDGSKPNAGCHSLAMVPVLKSTGADFIKEGTAYDIGGCHDVSDGLDNTMANHNQLCPPMNSGCDLSKTLIQNLDTQ